MAKEYIKDNGKIRNCDSNISKMNIFEYIWFIITAQHFFKYNILETLEEYKKGFINLGIGILNTILIIIFPITLIFIAYNDIKNAKSFPPL